MNTVQKSYRSNKKIKDWLIINDFEDIHFFPHTRYVKDVHFSGLDYDGIAAKANKVVLFQCKTNKKPSKNTISEYKKVAKKFGIICLWFNVVDRKGVSVYGSDFSVTNE